MADVTSRYTVLIAADGAPDALRAQITARLAAIEAATVGEAEVSEALGLSSRALMVTVVVSFATSVAANIATPTIETALADLIGAGAITLEDVLPEPATPAPDFPRTAILPDEQENPGTPGASGSAGSGGGR